MFTAQWLFVHDVRVSIMHARPQHRVGALQDGTEGHLWARREVSDRADVAGDVFLATGHGGSTGAWEISWEQVRWPDGFNMDSDMD